MKFLLSCAIALLAVHAVSAANIRASASTSTGASNSEPEAPEHSSSYQPDLNAHEISTENEAAAFFQKLLGKAKKIKEGTRTARKQSHDMCAKETAATKTWIKDGLSYEGEAARKARPS